MRDLLDRPSPQREYTRIARDGLAHEHPPQPRLLLKEAKERDQTRPHTLTPQNTPRTPHKHTLTSETQRSLKRRQKTLLAISEQVIERAPRDTRARDHVRDAHARHPPLTTLIDHPSENPRALKLGELHMRELLRDKNPTRTDT
jgi:hypothetical protein